MTKKDTKSLSITVSHKIFQKLEDGKYNISKLIVSLLEKYLRKK